MIEMDSEGELSCIQSSVCDVRGTMEVFVINNYQGGPYDARNPLRTDVGGCPRYCSVGGWLTHVSSEMVRGGQMGRPKRLGNRRHLGGKDTGAERKLQLRWAEVTQCTLARDGCRECVGIKSDALA